MGKNFQPTFRLHVSVVMATSVNDWVQAASIFQCLNFPITAKRKGSVVTVGCIQFFLGLRLGVRHRTVWEGKSMIHLEG